MSDKRLSEMSEQELRHEIQLCKEKMRKAEMNGIMNEYDVYESKVIVAESYLVDRSKINIGRMYKLNDGSEQYFKVERLKGVFAWGYRINSTNPEEGLPFALLKI
ncbi:YfhH family protein [Staphylococcus hominis]|uniref:YfhH family protein n=1 Tax=Staphylococcus hominis TaxID=1290 RepID=UPI001F57AAD4|nr:YfhH family protein [Staphylococcus hominis]MCI2847863.1 YfhH family protein [Staphylococcus hominis]MCI2850177.1 YfhH family protein [Staphylococcus hominis]MCI2856725.1 YfhH family protein [Staphylococcus hominis]